MKRSKTVGSFIAVFSVAACSPQDGTKLDSQDPHDSAATTNGTGHSGGSGGGGRGGGTQEPPGSEDASGLPCDVSGILAKNCQTCHGATPSFGAPMPLVTYADLTASAAGGQHIYDKVKARVHDDTRPMPPSPNPRLSASDLGVIDGWVAAGAPSSSTTCGSDPGVPPPKQLSCTPDTFIRGGSPFTMPQNTTDIYMCYGFDVTQAQKKQVVGFGPHIDNTKIVHHLLLFQSDSAYTTTPTECDVGSAAGWVLVTGWAPGGQPLEAPAQAGFPQEGTTHYVLQIHYNNASGQNAGQVDKSGYDLCTTTQLRPNDAGVMAFGTLNMTIPPHATTDITCDYTPLLIPDVHLFSASPHMHKLGKAMSTYVTHNGQKEKVVDQPAFDFNSQVGYPTSADLSSGDSVSTRCVWNNTTDQTVKWGEGTGAEMAFNFVGYYPLITSGLWSWTIPSALADCHPTN